MDTRKRDRFSSAGKRLADIEQRIGPFMPRPVVKSGVKRGEWHSNQNIPPPEELAKPDSKKKAAK